MAELLLSQGDYVLDGSGGLSRAEGSDGLLQQVIFQLVARRGGFSFLPDLGSQLYKLLREKPSQRESLALQYVVEALADISDLTVTDVTLAEVEDDLTVEVALDWGGESLSLTVGV